MGLITFVCIHIARLSQGRRYAANSCMVVMVLVGRTLTSSSFMYPLLAFDPESLDAFGDQRSATKRASW